MKDDDSIISDFGDDVSKVAPSAMDFTTAKRLDRGGSTCDAYLATVQRRKVFVKRLKKEFRDNPLYRAAFSKEFDLGVTFSHPSLPRYVGFGNDYIVMDFVEGDTLADLIRRHDPRLGDRRFVRKVLANLIDAVEYLHRRNVVHCDIKSDNIIVSPYADRPIVLVDFDKAYSPWLDTTHGNARLYGCDDCADGAVDYRGIGKIASRLGMKRLARLCKRPGVTADDLKTALRPRRLSAFRWVIIAIIVLTAGVLTVVLTDHDSPASAPATVDKPTDENVANDSDSVVGYVEPQPAATPPVVKEPAIDQAWITAMINERGAEIRALDRELVALLNNDTVPINVKPTAIMEHAFATGPLRSAIISDAVQRFHDVSELEVQHAVRSNPAWVRLEKEWEEMNRRINAWNAKVSRRSSSHPVLQPDTTRDADRPAQHQ